MNDAVGTLSPAGGAQAARTRDRARRRERRRRGATMMPFPFTRGGWTSRAGWRPDSRARHATWRNGADTVAGLCRLLTGFSICPWSLRPRHPTRSSVGNWSMLPPSAVPNTATGGTEADSGRGDTERQCDVQELEDQHLVIPVGPITTGDGSWVDLRA